MGKSFLEASFGYNINMAAMLLKRDLLGIFKQHGYDITPEQWAILSRLKEQDGVSQNEIALITFKDNANITRIVDKLEAKQLLVRKHHPDDRRTWLLYITDEGKALVKKLQPLAVELLNKASQGIAIKDVEVLNAHLKKLIENLK